MWFAEKVLRNVLKIKSKKILLNFLLKESNNDLRFAKEQNNILSLTKNNLEKTGNEKLLQDKIDQMNLELNLERNKNYDLERRLQVLFLILLTIERVLSF